MMKNAFYFTLKGYFVLKILTFLYSFISHAEKVAWLKKKMLISKFMTPQSGQ